MRWFWTRRNRARAARAEHAENTGQRPVEAPAPARAITTSGSLLADDLLRFARDCLLAAGATVRIEREDVLSAVLPDGTAVRYTTTLARAEEGVELLAEGTAALTALLEQSALQARVTALALVDAGDAAALALARCAVPRGIPSCAACPLRAGKLVVDGIAGARAAEVVRTWEARSVELTYLVHGRNRQGRRDEWVRVAVDRATGARCEPLTPEQLGRATAADLPNDASEQLASAREAAEGELTPALAAAASFLRQESEEDYLRGVEDLTAAHERLKREDPPAAGEIDRTLRRELATRSEVFAVDVEVQLESACFITSTRAEVSVGGSPESPAARLVVDLGRGTVEVCGASLDESGGAAAGHPGKDRPARARRRAADPAESALTIEHLDAMTPGMWHACVVWLLGRVGFTLAGESWAEDATLLRGHLNGEAASAGITRLPLGWLLGKADLEQLMARRTSAVNERLLLLTTADATAEAKAAASRLQVYLLDRAALRDLLSRVTTQHRRERSAARDEARTRADAASRARERMLAAIQKTEAAAQAPRTARAASGRTAILAAVAAVEAAAQEASRAFIAWDTLAEEWDAAFGEHAARDGSLATLADPPRLNELAARAGHLRAATVKVFAQLARAPGDGEMGYGPWRRAVAEELAQRCEAVRWRILAIDPARSADFTAARDLEAETNAARATTAASHAARRAAQAYSQMAARAAIPGDQSRGA